VQRSRVDSELQRGSHRQHFAVNRDPKAVSLVAVGEKLAGRQRFELSPLVGAVEHRVGEEPRQLPSSHPGREVCEELPAIERLPLSKMNPLLLVFIVADQKKWRPRRPGRSLSGDGQHQTAIVPNDSRGRHAKRRPLPVTLPPKQLALDDDVRVDAEGDVVQEVPSVHVSDIHGLRPSFRDVSDGATEIHRDTRVLREMIERSPWQYAERRVCPNQRRRDGADSAVAAGGDHDLCAFLDGGLGCGGRISRGQTGHEPDRQPRMAEMLREDGFGIVTGAAGRRVDDDSDHGLSGAKAEPLPRSAICLEHPVHWFGPGRRCVMFGIIGWIFFGLIVGALAKLVMPGRDPGGIIVTMLLGIVGAVLGGFIGRSLGLYGPQDGAGYLMSIVGAVVVLLLYRMLVRRPRTTL